MHQVDTVKAGVELLAPRGTAFDLELLYVQCSQCSRPVMWTRRRTEEVLHKVGISTAQLDASCLLLMRGCPHCTEGKSSFRMSVIRMDLLPKDTDLLSRDPKAGNA